jgi:hypothetical protein
MFTIIKLHCNRIDDIFRGLSREICRGRLASRPIFLLDSQAGPMVRHDFKESLIIPSCYEVRSHPGRGLEGTLRSWVFEGSIDGITWQVLDKRPDPLDANQETLRNGGAIGVFPVRVYRECRFVQICQTARDFKENDYLAVASLELYGTLLN